MPDFVHLHCHSEYSLLDGLCRLKPLVNQAKALDMPAVALTDHGVMYGAIEFYRAAREAGVKPIVGCELYIARRDMRDKDPEADKKSHHLVVLAENDTGYQNLLKIVSAAQLEGFYYKPRVDHAFLERHAEGLIALSACKSGEVIRHVYFPITAVVSLFSSTPDGSLIESAIVGAEGLVGYPFAITSGKMPFRAVVRRSCAQYRHR